MGLSPGPALDWESLLTRVPNLHYDGEVFTRRHLFALIGSALTGAGLKRGGVLRRGHTSKFTYLGLVPPDGCVDEDAWRAKIVTAFHARGCIVAPVSEILAADAPIIPENAVILCLRRSQEVYVYQPANPKSRVVIIAGRA